ncbi:hypothetical protein [Nocardia sp. IFM 10818]
MASRWVFAEPRNTEVFTTRSIVLGEDWIAYVFHDADDGGWQFLGSDPTAPTADDVVTIHLAEMADRDRSVRSLADLPLGWCAWRNAPSASWRRAPQTKGGRAPSSSVSR